MAARKRLQKGFTLIELLVVIGILGVLAGALFFTINPIEQLNRGDDAKLKSAAQSFSTAMNSYFSTNRDWPWNATSTPCGQSSITFPVSGDLTDTVPAGCVDVLQTNQFLRDTFDGDASVMGDLYLHAQSATSGYSICFAPSSAAEQNSSESDYNQTGGAYVSGTRYWCLVQ